MKTSNIFLALGSTGMVLAGIGLVLDHFYPPQLDFVQLPPEAKASAFSTPERIVSLDLGIDLPIEPGGVIDGAWSISPHTANYLQTSARPGSNGNIVVYGHDARSVLGPLKQAKPGQKITIQDTSQTQHVYKITDVYAIAPTDISPIEPTDQEMLTVYTCAGIFNEQRLIVRAKPAIAG